MKTVSDPPGAQTTASAQQRAKLLNWLRNRAAALAPFATLAILVIFFTFASDSFLNIDNLRNILAQIATLSIVATGMTFVLLCGQIDLSVAAVATMSGVIAATLFSDVGLPEILAIIVAALIALVFGIVSGWGTTKVGLPSFMMTLVGMQVANGLALYISKGKINYNVPPILKTLGSERLFGAIPLVVVAGAITLLVGHIVLTYTRFGRYVYMTGSNRVGAELSGINTRFVIGACLAISAFCAGLAGMLNTGRLGSAQSYGLDSFLLDSITAVVLGGTSLFGGQGGVKNTVIGLLVFGVLSNGLNQIQLDIYIRLLIAGLILLAALLINNYAMKLRSVQVEAE
jgi:ribose transport system permease protein